MLPDFYRNKFALDNWQPLFRRFDELFNDGWDREAVAPQRAFAPAAQVQENANGYTLSFDIPGLKKENINIELEGNELLISGERKSEKTDAKTHFSETRYGKFERRLRLWDGIKPSDVHAEYQDGVLQIAIPKQEQTKRTKIELNSGKFAERSPDKLA